MTVKELIKEMSNFTIDGDWEVCIEVDEVPNPIDRVHQDEDEKGNNMLVLKPAELTFIR